MPTDTRRIQGPESSTAYQLYVKKQAKESKNELLTKGNRQDGRTNSEPRSMYLETGVVSQAKGSAYVELNDTKVLCSVYNPREMPRKAEYSTNGEIYCEFKFAPFSCKKRRSHMTDAEERDYGVILRRALEPAVCLHEFPNFQVDVYVLVLENDGGALAAAITCAGLAVADASIPMFDLVIGASMAIHKDTTLVDPSASEETYCNLAPPSKESSKHGSITLGYLPSLEQISEIVQQGQMPIETVADSVKVLTDICQQTYPLVQRCLLTSVRRALKVKKKNAKWTAEKKKNVKEKSSK